MADQSLLHNFSFITGTIIYLPKGPRPSNVAMPSTHRPESGMLNRYLREQHTVFENVEAKRENQKRNPTNADNANADKQKQTVKDLERKFRVATAPGILNEARRAQKGMLSSS